MSAEAIRAQMTEMVQEAAEPRPVGDSVKAAINRAALRLRRPTGWVKRHWYGEVSRVEAHDYAETRRRIEEQRQRELEALRLQVSALEAQYREDRDAFEARTRELVGGFIPLLEKLGVVEARSEPAQEDGE